MASEQCLVRETHFFASLFESEYLSNEAEAIGFKVMYDQISLWPKLAYYAPSAGGLFEDLFFRRWLQVNRVLVIHTLRRNHLKLMVSHKLATESGRFHSRDAGTSKRQIVLPLRGLKTRLMRIEAAERTAGRRSLKIYRPSRSIMRTTSARRTLRTMPVFATLSDDPSRPRRLDILACQGHQ